MATKETLEKRTLSTNNYIALMAAASLMAILVTGFVLNSIGRDFIMNTKVIIGKQKAVSDLNTKIENANKLVDSYKNLGSRRDLVENAMPNKADFPQMVTIINNAGTAAGVRVTSIAPTATADTGEVAQTPAGGAQTFKFGVDLSGSYPRIRDFVRNLELSARPIKIDAIQVRGDSDSLRVNVALTSYYQEEANLDDKKEPVK